MTFRERMYPMGYLENVVKLIIMQNNKVKKWWLSLMIIICVIFSAWHYLKYRWKDILSPATYMVPYAVNSNYDDTLRVIMIGDSWAGMHKELECENTLADMISHIVHKPVTVKTNGRGGAKSKDVYFLMFNETASKVDTDQNYCTQPLIQNGPDYCIISAGINDADANLGAHLYCYHMRLILNFLFSNNIRPIVIEVPDVNIWKVHGGKPYKDLVSDYIRSMMSSCKMYQIKEYRDSLRSMLINENLMDSVLYIQMNEWNGEGTHINQLLFLDDQIHLNRKGYEMLDSCIVNAIYLDIMSRYSKCNKFVNCPMNNDAH